MRRLALFLLLLLAVAACDTTGVGPAVPEGVVFRSSGTDALQGIVVWPPGSLSLYGYAEGRVAPNDGTNAYPLLVRLGTGSYPQTSAVYRNQEYGRVEAAVALGDELALLIRQHGELGAPMELTLYFSDPSGLLKPVRSFDGAYGASDMIRTRDGGLLLSVFPRSTTLPHLYKLNPAGKVLWTHRVAQMQDVHHIAEDAQGNLYLAGQAADTNDLLLARLSSDGSEDWLRTVGAGDDTLRRSYGLVATAEHVVVLNRQIEPYPGEVSIRLTAFTGAGTSAWETTAATGRMIHASALTALPDGSLVFALMTEHYQEEEPLQGNRAEIIWTDARGNERRRHAFGPETGTTYVADLQPLPDGRLAAAGATGPAFLPGEGGGDLDAYFRTYR